MPIPTPMDARDAHPPDQPQPLPRPADSRWLTVTGVVLVLGCSTVLLLTGTALYDALLSAGGMAIAGNEVARRVITDANPVPIVIVGSAVTAFGAVLIILGYGFPQAALGAGIAGLAAGETAARMFGTRRDRRGV